MQEHTVTVHIELSAQHAWALAQLLKRIGFSDCRTLAEDEQQTYLMLQALEYTRWALASAGFAPR